MEAHSIFLSICKDFIHRLITYEQNLKPTAVQLLVYQNKVIITLLLRKDGFPD